MNLLCGSNTSDQNNDTLNQYDEGQRAHTIKFMSNQIENHTDLNKINNNNNKSINNLKLEIPKSSVNSNINKELLIKNKSLKDSIKCSNNASELEIIEYPVDEDKKSDFKNINDILISQAKDYINDKDQDDIIDYLKGKEGLNYLSLLLGNDNDNDKESDNSNKKHNANDSNNESSGSDEIICSYIEIDRNNNSVLNRMSKEKSVIKKSSFSKTHQSSLSDCSLMLKNYDTNTANNLEKIAQTIESKFKNNQEGKKKNAVKENKNKNTDMKFKKQLNHTLTPNYNTLTSKNKKVKKEEKEKETETEREKNKDADKTTLATEEKNNQRSPHINKSNKKKNIPINKNKLESFRTIESLNNIININPISKGKKYIKKDKKSLGKSKMIQFERCKPKNCTIDKNINSIDKNYSQVSQIYKSIKGSSTNNKKRHIYHKEKMAMTMNNNMLFNSINVKGNKKFNKGNFLSLKKSLLNPMRVDSKNKTINEKANESNSKLKLRKLLINNNPNQKNYKHKCDLSMYNINCLSNNCTLAMKKGKNKTLSKIMNKSEANKQFNNTIKVKSNNNNNNNNDFRPNKNLYIHTSISKILK